MLGSRPRPWFDPFNRTGKNPITRPDLSPDSASMHDARLNLSFANSRQFGLTSRLM